MFPLSKIALAFCLAAMSYTAFVFYPKWEKETTEATLSWDASGYYLYLPAVFIYHDLKGCKFFDSTLSKYQFSSDFQQAYVHQPSGNYVMKYTAGQALIMAPFFLVAHIWASGSSSYPADGFSYPYQWSIGVGLFLLGIIGLFVLRKVLLHYYADSTVAIVLLCFVVGTNYLNYAAIDQAMPHSSLFTIYALLLWASTRFYRNPSLRIALAIGVLAGLAILIRPTEIVAILIPLLWGLGRFQELRGRLIFLRQHYRVVLAAAILALCIVAIQPLYWHWATGQWLVYSYQDQGFYWSRPHVADYLFSYSCGWLRYCPMMALALLGLLPFWFRGANRLAIVLLTLVSLYLVTAWDVWDYGGTAGRAMVQYYPILAFPFAALVDWVNRSRIFPIIIYSLVLLFTYINIWWVYHAHLGNIKTTGLTPAYYWAVITKWTANEEDTKLLDNPHVYHGLPQQEAVLYQNNFDSDTSANAITTAGNTQLQLSERLQNTSYYYVQPPPKTTKWIRASATFTSTEKEWTVWKQAQFNLQFYNKGGIVQTNMIRIFRFLSNEERKRLWVDAIVPPQWDSLSVHVWNSDSHKTVFVDSLKVIGF